MPTKLTNEKVKNIISLDKEYEIANDFEYKNNRTKNIPIRHKLCGTEFFVCLDGWKRGNRPHRCKYKKSCTLRKTTEEFKKEVETLDPDYEVIGEYINKNSKIEILHKSKNHIYLTTPDDFLSGCRCSICNKKKLKTTEEFKKEVETLDPDYEVIGEYINALSKIEMFHTYCGKSYFVRPNDFLSSESRCPYCYTSHYSKGERRIAKILSENKIDFIQQHRFKDCVYKNALKFDFYIPSINTCIEYDGEYHYIDIRGQLKTTQIRDYVKTKYCEDNGIRLIRISYLEKNKIDNIINILYE